MTIQHIAVIGAGTMGHGIAQVFALAGYKVTITDIDAATLEKAISRIQANLETCVKFGAIDKDKAAHTTDRIELSSNIADASEKADFIVEAVIENIEVKHKILRNLEKSIQDNAIITSTTSSYCVSDLVSALKRPERFLVTHYWNPPYIIPVVEVMPGEHTSADVTHSTLSLLKSVGKHPALVKKDVPGFIGNRLQHALRREAISIVDQGIASPEDVDLIAKLSFGLRMPIVGPLETVDFGGLDLTQAIQTYLLPELDRSTEPIKIIRDKVAQGELGVKTGEGFFKWPPDKAAKVAQQRNETLLELINFLKDRGYL